jgi:hypothetical protein
LARQVGFGTQGRVNGQAFDQFFMNWFYAINRERKGPVSEDEFRDLVHTGQVKHDTLVWNEEMENWEPYAKVQAASVTEVIPPSIPAAEPTASASISAPATEGVQNSPGGIVCAGCGEQFHFDSVTRVGDVYSCHFCRPGLEERQQDTVSDDRAVPPEVLADSDYESPLGSCVGRGIELYGKHVLALLAATALLYLVRMLVVGVAGLFIGMIINGLLFGALMGGYWKCFILRSRGEPASGGTALSGFGPQTIDLIVTGVLWSLIPTLFLAPGMFLTIVGAAFGSGSLALLGTGACLLGMMFATYLLIAWMFAIPLVADKRLSVWPAMQLSRLMVSKHWWANLGLVVVMGFFLVAPQALLIYKAFPVVTELIEELGPEFYKNPAAIDPERLAPITKYAWILPIWGVLYLPFFMSCLAVRYNDMFGRLREE